MPANKRAPHPDDWKPNPGPQSRFLSLTCFEALYGGSAGGGKSDSILVDAIRYVGKGYGAAYQALLLRTTFPALASCSATSREMLMSTSTRVRRFSSALLLARRFFLPMGHGDRSN